MVTFATASATPATIPLRAPAQSRVKHFVAIRCELTKHSCDAFDSHRRTNTQLVFPSRDPIGYQNSRDHFSYVGNQPLILIYPSGLVEINNQPHQIVIHDWRGIYKGVGVRKNITFSFDNLEFMSFGGCCKCNSVAIVQSAKISTLYGKREDKIHRPVDGGNPYPYVDISRDVQYQERLHSFFNPCANPFGNTWLMVHDDPWAPTWDRWDALFPFFGVDRLLEFHFEGRTCLVCIETRYITDMGHPSDDATDIPIHGVSEEFACADWGFTIRWNGSTYVGD